MTKARQDAWTDEEDKYLADTVLHYVRDGRTQLGAFSEAAEGLARTPAACGYRWNAEIRGHYQEEIDEAKSVRRKTAATYNVEHEAEKVESIDSVIMFLKRVKAEVMIPEINDDLQTVVELRKENKKLRKNVKRYEDAWREMGKLWQWIHDLNENKNEH